MDKGSRVLRTVAQLFENTTAGKHGEGRLDVQLGYEELLARAGCAEGELRELAERELHRAAEAGILQLVPIHRRDSKHFAKVRFSPAKEQPLYDMLGMKSPAQKRGEWVALFERAKSWGIPENLKAEWVAFCEKRARAALTWRTMQPFDRENLPEGEELLKLLNRLLAWEGKTLIRWASSLLCGDSKCLERRQKTLEFLLQDATNCRITKYDELGILPVPPEVYFHGPIRFRIGEDWRDYNGYNGAVRISGLDIDRITKIECNSSRLLTVENKTPFLALAGLDSGEVLLQTSYPNEPTVRFLRMIHLEHPQMEFWHFGDTDPAGFHILADLRERTGIPIKSFQMKYRPKEGSPALSPREQELIRELIGRMPEEKPELERMLAAGRKGDFEQESLQPPSNPKWPFYQ